MARMQVTSIFSSQGSARTSDWACRATASPTKRL